MTGMAKPASLGSLPSVMRKDFSRVPDLQIPRSKFHRPCGLKTTFDAGYLIPVYIDEVIPGDTHNVRASFFARLATPIKPIMDNMFLDSMFFFCPMRLVWDNAKRFFGERDPDPDSSIDYDIPTITLPASTGAAVGSVYDYFGLPVGVADLEVNALPLRCMNKIYNDWIRDENLIDSVPLETGDSGDDSDDYELLRAGKRYDYFTSCLPTAQKGTAVSLPLGTEAEIKAYTNADGDPNLVRIADDDSLVNVTSDLRTYSSTGAMQITTGPYNVYLDPNGKWYADLTNATAATIESLRNAVQIQELLERDSRGGTRYIEHNWVHFRVRSSDARLQRSEYLGGGTTPVNLHPVAQTTAQSSPTLKDAQGNLAAFGTVMAQNHGFSRSFEEHGYILGFVRVRADQTYQHGLDRLWTRETRYDFPYPVFAHLGEQAVLTKEIYCDGTSSDDDVFGYQERYAEFRYHRSKITGSFRSAASTPLDYWHLAPKLTTHPSLDETFIQEDPPIDRCIAVTTEPHFMMDAYFDVVSARPLPVYGVPRLGGRL